VIGSDHIVPPNVGPIDLGVFCVEPGVGWHQATSLAQWDADGAASVRTPAMAERNQSEVWANVRSSNAKMASSLAGAEAGALPRQLLRQGL